MNNVLVNYAVEMEANLRIKSHERRCRDAGIAHIRFLLNYPVAMEGNFRIRSYEKDGMVRE